jgi:hypothetical protein
MKLQRPSREQWRSSLRAAVAALIAAAITLRWSGDPRLDLWYCLYGVARSNLADQRVSARAARERILGTLFGGAIATALLLLGGGWIWVGIAYLLVELLGNPLRLSAGSRSNATVVAVLMFLVPADAGSGAFYVFFRTLWHLLGLAIGMAVEHLFWPRGDRERLQETEADLLEALQTVEKRMGADPPGELDPLGLERRLVGGLRRLRELGQLLREEQPGRWAAQGREERLRQLEQAVIQAMALLRRGPAEAGGGALARRSAALDRAALAGSLAMLRQP